MRRSFFLPLTLAALFFALPVGAQPITKGQVVLDGTPEVPKQLADRMRPYLNTRSADISDLSDDGKTMLITTRFAETAQLHVVKGPLAARTQLTFNTDPVAAASFRPGSDRVVVYATDQGGNENYQFFRLDLDTFATSLLTDGKSRNIEAVWSPTGDKLFFSSNARNGRDMDLWLSDGTGAKKAELFLEREGHWVPLEVSRDGKKLLLRQLISIADSQLYVLDLSTKQVSRLTPEQPKAAYRSAVFAANHTSVYVSSDREGDLIELYETSTDGKTWKPLSRHIRWDIESMALSGDGKTLAFETNENGISVLHFLDTKSGKERAETTLPKGVITSLKFAKKTNLLGFGLSSASRVNDTYTLEPAKKKLVRWTESEMGGLDRSKLVEPALIEYTTFDGKKIPAFYFEPKGTGPFPVIIDIHGGPESQARPWFSPMVQYMVGELGVAVFVPNVRGSDGFGKTYLSLDNGFKRMDSVKDIGALLDHLAKNPKLDAKRVAVYGGSYGGFMVLASLIEYGDRIRAGVDIVGISNFVTFLEKTSEYRRDLRRVEYGDERDAKMREHLLKISPTAGAQKIRSRLFVAQGANDPRVPAAESEQIVKAVRGQGQEVWYLLAKNEGHGFRQKENRDLFSQLYAMFIEKHLLAAPAASGAKTK
jgi:dipeptidyl aminopeptidase/acylaminoacyl peptidase